MFQFDGYLIRLEKTVEKVILKIDDQHELHKGINLSSSVKMNFSSKQCFTITSLVRLGQAFKYIK